MALALCESCRRHVRTTDTACPFCKTVRAGAKAVVVASSIFALAGCGETFSPAAKYGGPPDNTQLTVTPMPEAGPPEVVSPAAKYGGPPMDTQPPTPDPTPVATDTPDASPRITSGADAGPGGRKFAPVALYGAPPRRKPTPPTTQ